MSAFAPLSEYQFQQLALGKARGFTWNMMADQLSLPLHVVERVPWTHEKLWNRHLAKAERLIARETIAETASTLRRDLRNAEPNLHATLANSLTRLLQLQQDFAPPRRPRPVNPITPTATPVAPAPMPVSTPVPTPTPVAAPTPAGGPSLPGVLSAVVGLLFLLCALFMGCGSPSRPTKADAEPCLLVAGPRAIVVAAAEAKALRVVQAPSWYSEPDIVHGAPAT